MQFLRCSRLISIPGAAYAQTKRAGTFTISPIFGGFDWDEDEHVGNGPEYGIGAGYNFTDHFGTELMFNFADPGTDKEFDTGDINLWLLHLDFVYHFNKLWIFDPYVVAGRRNRSDQPVEGRPPDAHVRFDFLVQLRRRYRIFRF